MYKDKLVINVIKIKYVKYIWLYIDFPLTGLPSFFDEMIYLGYVAKLALDIIRFTTCRTPCHFLVHILTWLLLFKDDVV